MYDMFCLTSNIFIYSFFHSESVVSNNKKLIIYVSYIQCILASSSTSLTRSSTFASRLIPVLSKSYWGKARLGMPNRIWFHLGELSAKQHIILHNKLTIKLLQIFFISDRGRSRKVSIWSPSINPEEASVCRSLWKDLQRAWGMWPTLAIVLDRLVSICLRRLYRGSVIQPRIPEEVGCVKK